MFDFEAKLNDCFSNISPKKNNIFSFFIEVNATYCTYLPIKCSSLFRRVYHLGSKGSDFFVIY